MTRNFEPDRLVRFGPQDASRRRLKHPVWGGRYRNWSWRERCLPVPPAKLLPFQPVLPALAEVSRQLLHVGLPQRKRQKRRLFVQRLRAAA